MTGKEKYQNLIATNEARVKQYVENYNSVLDLGCSDGSQLMYIEGLGFTKLVGIDSEEIYWFNGYHTMHMHLGNHNLQGNHLEYATRWKDLETAFDKKFTFATSDVTTYPFEQEKYSCIFCHYLIHLLPDEEQPKLIKRIYDSLEPSGVVFIKVNTKEYIKTLNRDKVEIIDNRIVKGFKDGKEKNMFLYSEDEFDSMIKMFPWTIEDRMVTDDYKLKYVLKKPA